MDYRDKIIKPAIIMILVFILTIFIARKIASGDTLRQYEQERMDKGEIATASDGTYRGEDTITDKDDQEHSVPEKVKEKADDITSEEDGSEGATASDAVKEPEKEETSQETDADMDKATDGIAADTTENIEDTAAEVTETAEGSYEYAPGFTSSMIPDDVFERMLNVSYPEGCEVQTDELRYLRVLYIDFDGKEQSGELVCNASIAEDLLEIFNEFYKADYRLESVRLVDDFGGDDTASMEADNTSCFNDRLVEGTDRLSNHARGLAIDVNPFYNPYITYPGGKQRISPKGSEPYADRSADFPYKIDENDLAYKLFKAHGFRWGGDWNSSKDYQHFEKTK